MNSESGAGAKDIFATETTRFLDIVCREFRFLVDERHFDEPTIIEENAANWYERRVAARYLGRDVGLAIEVELRFADPAINVALIALDGREFPRKYSFYGDVGHQPAVSLDSFVQCITNNAIQPLLQWPEFGSSPSAIGKGMDSRKAMIQGDMEGVIAEYASRLHKYCAAVLDGDQSRFPEVAIFHRRKFRGV